MHRDLTSSTRRQISSIEATHGHSEVLAAVLEHAPAISAALTSAQIRSVDEARQLEELLTRRSLQLAESLLRQTLTSHARAYNSKVVLQNAQGLVELSLLIQNSLSRNPKPGEKNG
jgi:hypothetical protein